MMKRSNGFHTKSVGSKPISKQIKENARENNTPALDYQGWCVPSPNFPIESVDRDSLSPQRFYQDYVRLRKPVVLKGSLLPADLKQLELWKDPNNNALLEKAAGDELVEVEVREHSTETFGRGQQATMTFREFLALVEQGNDRHYLTTQNVEADENGRPDLLSPFMKRLVSNFPLRPQLAGHLIPSNINMWMGNNKDNSSSGLHHDYHDNLYIVLRGKKSFRLYSPQDAPYLYTIGILERIHCNGRINHQGEPTTAYGADRQADAAARAARAKEHAEQLLAQAELAVEQQQPGAEKQLEEAEEVLDQALEAVLEAEISDQEGDGDDEEEDDDTVVDEELDEFENNGEHKKEEPNDLDQKPSARTGPTDGKRRLVDKSVKDPNNFSRIPVALLDNPQEVQKQFPDFSKATPAFCEVETGDMLYLPASWFHEVKSYGQGRSGGHLAFNYWFHPPDAKNNFEQPYTSDFWSNDYDERNLKDDKSQA